MPRNQLGEYVAYAIAYGQFMNTLLLVFNLLPIFPMDGGRIVQELLWLKLGYRRSLQIAGMIGTVGGAVLVVLGLGLAQIQAVDSLSTTSPAPVELAALQPGTWSQRHLVHDRTDGGDGIVCDIPAVAGNRRLAEELTDEERGVRR